MTQDSIREGVFRILRTIAPDQEPADVDPTAELRDALDLDSMDFLHFVVALHDTFGVSVPERDYRQISTLDGCTRYLAEHTGGGASAPSASPPR